MSARSDKPLGGRAYGSIPHLPGSRQGRDDIGVNPGHARICLAAPRKGDTIVVLEKLDGSCVAVANVDGTIIPIIRAGYAASTSQREQHQLFAAWVRDRIGQFRFLNPGERVCGEWLALAHGTRYDLAGRDPFVAFDIIGPFGRRPWREVETRCGVGGGLTTAPHLITSNDGVSIDDALAALGEYGHYGAVDAVEGAVWRVENARGVEFLAKYVRPGKVDGSYFADVSGADDVWNWRP